MYKESAAKMAVLEARAEEADKLKELIATIESREEQVKELDRRLVQGDLFDSKKLIEEAATETNIIIRSLKPTVRGEEGLRASQRSVAGLKIADFRMLLTATYKQLTNFIEYLRERQLISVNRLIKQADSDECTLSFSVYIKR